MSLLAILEASAATAKVSGIATSNQLLPEVAPEDDELPAVIQQPVDGDIVWAVQQEHLTHRWTLDILVSRAGDNPTEQTATLTLLPLVIAAFRTNMSLGLGADGVRNCRPISYELVMLTIYSVPYNAVRIHMQAEEKYGVSLAA